MSRVLTRALRRLVADLGWWMCRRYSTRQRLTARCRRVLDLL